MKRQSCDRGEGCSFTTVYTGNLARHKLTQHTLEKKKIGRPWKVSFATHPKAVCWSKKNKLLASEVALNCNDKYLLDCDKCGREFAARPSNINNGRGCPFCARIPHDSFATHPQAACWSKKNKMLASEVAIRSGKKCLFDCVKCGREFATTVSNGVRGTCPFCSRYIPNDSFATHPRAACWSKKNKLLASEVALYSSKKALFDCDRCGREFNTRVSGVSAGKWCPHCRNKTEAILLDFFRSVTTKTIEQQKTFDFCRNPATKKHCLFRYDFFTFGKIVELDGPQHFRWANRNWPPPEEQQKRDRYKEQCAVENGISVIRLKQEDVLNNTNHWQFKLLMALHRQPENAEILYLWDIVLLSHVVEPWYMSFSNIK